jgi:hypothetical protein
MIRSELFRCLELVSFQKVFVAECLAMNFAARADVRALVRHAAPTPVASTTAATRVRWHRRHRRDSPADDSSAPNIITTSRSRAHRRRGGTRDDDGIITAIIILADTSDDDDDDDDDDDGLRPTRIPSSGTRDYQSNLTTSRPAQ